VVFVVIAYRDKESCQLSLCVACAATPDDDGGMNQGEWKRLSIATHRTRLVCQKIQRRFACGL
jgi:hypothetical protein